MSPDASLALAAIESSGGAIVGAALPVEELVGLARVAAQWGASLTVRDARNLSQQDVESIARAGRGRVIFDFTGRASM